MAVRMRQRWMTVSIHAEYRAKLQELKTRHRRSFTNMVELLIDKALADGQAIDPDLRLVGQGSRQEGAGEGPRS